MKTNENFVLRPLGREFIVTAEGLSRVNFNKIISLNETAAFLWRAFEGKGDFTIDDMVKQLLENYEVEESVARADCEKLAVSWKEAGIVSE